MRTAKNILQHELIGMEVEIVNCTVSEKSNSSGTIIDETRNMLIIEQGGKDVNIPKHGTRLAFKLPESENQPDKLVRIEIEGDKFIARPEDRVKKNEPKTRRK